MDRKHGSAPWGEMNTNPDKFHDEDQVPEGFQWQDPEHMNREMAQLLISYWADREDDDIPPFVFKEPEEKLQAKEATENRRKHARQLKQKKDAYVEVESPDQSEEDGKLCF